MNTFANRVVVNANGTLGAPVAGDFTGADFSLIPGVLHAYKVSAEDLAAYAAPVPEPETTALLIAGLGVVGLQARRRRRTLTAGAVSLR